MFDLPSHPLPPAVVETTGGRNDLLVANGTLASMSVFNEVKLAIAMIHDDMFSIGWTLLVLTKTIQTQARAGHMPPRC